MCSRCQNFWLAAGLGLARVIKENGFGGLERTEMGDSEKGEGR